MSEGGSERIVFGAIVQPDGKLKPDTGNRTRGRLARWSGRHVMVTVRRFVKPKSNDQLALYFGPVIEGWSEFTGYDPDEMDYELRRAYLAPQLAMAKLTGEEVEERPRIRDLTSEEMSTFLDRCLREGRQRGIEFETDRSSG